MATMHSTGRGRTGRNRSSRGSNRRAKTSADSKAGAKRPIPREHLLSGGLINAVEEQRAALSIALTLLTSLDVTLQQGEEGGGDILDEGDATDILVLRARAMVRPVHLVRLAIQRVYQAQAGLDSLYLEQAAGNG